MARILGIDYGEVRCGIATTDPLQIIVTSLSSVSTNQLKVFLIDYCKKESVEKIVLGIPKHHDGNETHIVPAIKKLALELTKEIQNISLDFQDERNTSVLAKGILVKSGVKKEKRKEKARIDEISAVLILQRYLGHF